MVDLRYGIAAVVVRIVNTATIPIKSSVLDTHAAPLRRGPARPIFDDSGSLVHGYQASARLSYAEDRLDPGPKPFFRTYPLRPLTRCLQATMDQIVAVNLYEVPKSIRPLGLGLGKVTRPFRDAGFLMTATVDVVGTAQLQHMAAGLCPLMFAVVADRRITNTPCKVLS